MVRTEMCEQAVDGVCVGGGGVGDSDLQRIYTTDGLYILDVAITYKFNDGRRP